MNVQVIVYIPEEDVKSLDELVKMGKYKSRAESIRKAIKMLLQTEHPKYAKSTNI